MSLTIVGYYLMAYGRGGFGDTSVAYFAEYEPALKAKRHLESRNCGPYRIEPDYRMTPHANPQRTAQPC
jgi:uncharacterized protein YjhX (UPF0386 family)